jgi:hypothetical protein
MEAADVQDAFIEADVIQVSEELSYRAGFGDELHGWIVSRWRVLSILWREMSKPGRGRWLDFDRAARTAFVLLLAATN